MKSITPGFKLSSYSTAALASLITVNSQAQIVYQDLDPDILMDPEHTCIPDPPGYDYSPGGDFSCGETLYQYFDINFDGNIDFKLKVNHDYWSYWPSQYHTNRAEIFPYALNEVQANITNGDLKKNLLGDNIGPGINWFDIKCRLGYANYEAWDTAGGHDFEDSKYAFAGLKLIDGGNEYYGWMRLSVDTMTDFVIIHDFAYNANPGAPILGGETGDCYPPSISEVVNIMPASAKLQWAPVFNATKYQLYYRKTGVAAWTKLQFGPATIQKTITGLLCDSEYEWKMRTKCGAELSEFSAIHTFNTASCRIEEMAGDEEPILIYPNPASHNIIIELQQFSTMENEDIQIDIFDVTGRKMDSYITTDLTVNLNISAYPKGNYIVKVNSASLNSVGKFIVQ